MCTSGIKAFSRNMIRMNDGSVSLFEFEGNTDVL